MEFVKKNLKFVIVAGAASLVAYRTYKHYRSSEFRRNLVAAFNDFKFMFGYGRVSDEELRHIERTYRDEP